MVGLAKRISGVEHRYAVVTVLCGKLIQRLATVEKQARRCRQRHSSSTPPGAGAGLDIEEHVDIEDHTYVLRRKTK